MQVHPAEEEAAGGGGGRRGAGRLRVRLQVSDRTLQYVTVGHIALQYLARRYITLQCVKVCYTVLQ